jgi:hypothetical protein
VAVSPISVINWHPHKFTFWREQSSAIAASHVSDIYPEKAVETKLKIHKLRCELIVIGMYISKGMICLVKIENKGNDNA